jgi:hypothetical protein
LQPLRQAGQCRGRVSSYVVEQAEDNLAVTPLRPAAYDLAIPPDRRANVAGPIV